MPGNSFGTQLRITTFGESHGKGVGVVIDGFPAGFPVDLEMVQRELDRRRPGQSSLVSPRKELDVAENLSGLFEGRTTGAPLMFVVHNADARSKDYEAIKDLFRPGHADFTYHAKYTHRDYRGGGRSSARETIGRVIGGALAKQLLQTAGVQIRGGVTQVGTVKANRFDWSQVESNPVRGVDPDCVPAMIEEIERARKERDSVGGVVQIEAHGVPVGLGEPVFDRLDAVIAYAMMSLPAVKGVEVGVGFQAASMRGSEMNDLFYPDGFASNHHGGVLGGISSGAPIVCRFAVKPTSSLPRDQKTIDQNGAEREIKTLGRHDPCVALRAVPIGEAMLALVLADFWLRDLAESGVREFFNPRQKTQYGVRGER